MRELQQLKKVRLGQDPNLDVENNLLSLVIQSDAIFTAIRVPKERFSETFDPIDHATTFESHMDLIVLLTPPSAERSQRPLEEWLGHGMIHFLLNLLRALNALRSCS